jgi:hypothetical protein
VTPKAETVRRYQRRAIGVTGVVLVWFGLAGLVSPIGNRLSAAVMLAVGLVDLVVLRYRS